MLFSSHLLAKLDDMIQKSHFRELSDVFNQKKFFLMTSLDRLDSLVTIFTIYSNKNSNHCVDTKPKNITTNNC